MTTVSALLWCGVVAGPFFVLVFLVQDFLRHDYNPLRQPVSSLSQGPRGWIQQSNFFITGALLVAFASGLFGLTSLGSWWGPFFIFLHGAGLLGAGAVVTDYGIRRGDSFSAHTISGILHDLFSTVVFISLSIGCFIFAHLFSSLSLPGWALYSSITGALYAIGFIIFGGGFAKTSKLASIAGLLQRLTIVVGAIWITLVALHLLIG